ncbi:hypothetical protein HELRODRAFT_194539 [Helobdella robusta]|uniref:RRM domain-containing protein n=1 Tax=Helobdella robusta TaxID=6412 RepID=T1FW63_HELRO|nr:hypothetical protein HELRODRAFT_194539 [Helobdella robusta]ESN91144.1 hypothetical protein HELRODRAFT_194539 [Helobdella robusta]
MAKESIDGIDLYADVDDFGPDHEYQDSEMFDVMASRHGDPFEDTKYSSQYSRHSSFNGKKFSLYVANLSWWTTDKDLADAIASLGINDLIDIKFHENRVNGQSKGFATVTVNSEMSSKILLDKLSKREIHGQQVVVTHCTAMALKQFDTSAATAATSSASATAAGKKEPASPMYNGQQPLAAPPSHLSQPQFRLRPPPQPHQQQLQHQQPPHQQQLHSSIINMPTTRPGHPPNLAQGPTPNHPGPLLGGPGQSPRVLLPSGPNTALPPPALTGMVGGGGGAVRHFGGPSGIAGGLQPSSLHPPGLTGAGPGLTGMGMAGATGGGPGVAPLTPNVNPIQSPHHPPHHLPPGQLQLRAPPSMGLRGVVPPSSMELRADHYDPNLFIIINYEGFQQPPPVVVRQSLGQIVLQQQQQQQNQPTDVLGRQIPLFQQPAVDPFRERNPLGQPILHGTPIITPSPSNSSSSLPLDMYARERAEREQAEREHIDKDWRQQQQLQQQLQQQQSQFSPQSREQVKTEASSSATQQHQQQQQQLSDMQEFEDILQRNKSVSSSAISRAVQDASEYASAIETLVTAISLIKQSKIASDDRCKILVSSLQDTLRGIEDKSYGSKSSRSDHRRSRSPRDRSTTKTSSRHNRSRSRDRDYRESRSSRDKDRYYDKYDYKDRDYKESARDYKESSSRDYKESSSRDYKDSGRDYKDYKESGRDYKEYKESRSGRH